MSVNKVISGRELLESLSFCVFDLETTGGNQKSDKIIEIGLVKISNLKVVDKKDFLIKPEIPIPDFIQRLTSITPKKTAKSPVIEDVIDEILEFMSDSILVAHNTSFDVPFFNSVLERLGRKQIKNRNICTNLMTKYLIPGLMNSNLNYMSNIFGIGHKRAHRAKDDAHATALLLLKYLDIFIEKDIKKINHLYYPRNRYELDRTNFKRDEISIEDLISKFRNVGSVAFSTVLKGSKGEIVFVSADTEKGFDEVFLKEVLKRLEWETVTINLYGNLPEAFIAIRPFLSKINKNECAKVLDYFSIRYLGGESFDHLTEMYQNVENSAGFYILHHLVPEQFVVINFINISIKDKLLFRFPGHEKKFWQYLKSRTRNKKKNMVKSRDEILEVFLYSYMKSASVDYSGLFIPLADVVSGEFDVSKKLSKYVTKHPNSNNYPKNYI